MKKGIIILAYLAVVLSSPAWSSAATLEVGPNKTYSAIQSAISDATNEDTVLVYDGTYIENINFLGKALSVKSVNGAESTIIDGNENGHVVTFNTNEGLDSVLEGFTIMHGKGTAPYGQYDGGGIYGVGVSPIINSCVIKSNSAQVGGGGVYLYNSSPRFNNCTITENWTTTEVDFGPGGLMLISSDTTSFPTLTNCSISSNHGGYSGGGIYCSQATLINCTIRNCSAENRFGGLELSSSTMTNCTISGNSSASGSGGIRAYNSHVNNCIITGNSTYYGAGGGIYSVNSYINNCIITGNSAGYGAGGGIYSVNSHINNCIITGNRAKYGGGIYCSGPSTTITNCTISGNEANDADGNGGGIYCEGSSPVIINSILWGNTATLSGNEIYLDGASAANISYTDIDQDGYAGSNGNIRQDPLITRMPSPGADTIWGTEDDDLGDLHLHPDSPCIDAGTSDNAPVNDIVGTPRPQGAGFDMGAYEYALTDKIRGLVDEYYFDILDREPDQEGLNYWTSEIERIMVLGINVGEGFQAEARFFFTCQEYKDKNKTEKEFVTDLYQTFLQREPDAGGIAYWACQLSRG